MGKRDIYHADTVHWFYTEDAWEAHQAKIISRAGDKLVIRYLYEGAEVVCKTRLKDFIRGCRRAKKAFDLELK